MYNLTHMRPIRAKFVSRVVLLSTLVFMFLTGVILAAGPARADVPGCVQQYWLYGLRGTTRTICDGPVRADGSWTRARSFYAPSYWAPVNCYSTRYSTSCTGGYPVAEFNKEDVYTVTDATVLPDEPGWIVH